MSSLSGMQLDRLRESLRVPDVFGDRYRVLSEIGRGGMGVVYLAEDARLRRNVALKVIDPGIATVELEARLEHEARLLGRLGHPGIVPIYDLGRHDELTLFYVMQHVDGQTLERWLPSHPSRAERLRLFQKLCDPVAFAHAQGVVHRDLKPANVMIGAFGEVLVMDWGLAQPIDAAAAAEQVGTPGYRDPAGAARLIAADIFSLGAILYFVLVGKHPPREGHGPLKPREADAGLDPRLNAICARATQPQPDQRYPSVRELEEDILRYLDGESVLAYRERWFERVGRWIRRYQLWLSLIMMYLLMRVVVALIR
jgi:eukaryotic-like serine/threonine-protein kinase